MTTPNNPRTASAFFNQLSGAEAARQSWRRTHLAAQASAMNRYLGALAPVVELD